MTSTGAIVERLRTLDRRVENGIIEEIGTFQLGDRSLLRQLFSPESGHVSDTGLVLCPSLIEFTTLQRTEIMLARRAASAGHACIYAQPPGSGDSEGDSDTCTVARRVETASQAFSELKRRFPNVTRACFVGARLGGTIAALTAQTRGAGDGAALWDPALDASTYWEQARRMARISAVVRGHAEFVDPQKKLEQEGRASILGHEITTELIDDLREIANLYDGPPMPGPVLVVTLSESLASEAAERLQGIAPELEVHNLALKNQWHLGVAEAPEAIDPTLGWIQRRFG